MDPELVAVRNLTYRVFAELGRAPSAAELALKASLSGTEIEASWQELYRQHALALKPGDTELLMANPFSAVLTPYRVHAAGRRWYANCAWDAIGICAALDADGEVEASCPDCDESILLACRNKRVDDESLLFHCLVPAARWWDDIAFA